TSSANAPYPVIAITWSPGLRVVTPSPTAVTMPASSLPGEKGSGGFNWYLFSMISTSGKLTLAALTATTASPGPGTGDATSSKTSDSGGPNALQRIAFMSPQTITQFVFQEAGSPAVTGMHWPEMLRAPSLHRNAASDAMSSAVDMRCSGDRSTNDLRIRSTSTPRTSACPWMTRSIRSPATAPGAIAL